MSIRATCIGKARCRDERMVPLADVNLLGIELDLGADENDPSSVLWIFSQRSRSSCRRHGGRPPHLSHPRYPLGPGEVDA
jgi:hypothetical protein